MAKIAGINYSRTGIASMGRHDVSAPARAHAAESRLRTSIVKGVVGMAKQVKEANEAADAINISSVMSEKMGELNARIKHQKSYTKQELKELGVEYKDEANRDILPASEVAETVYKQLAAKVKEEAMGGASSTKSKGAVNRIYGSLYKSGIDDAVLHSIAHANAEVKIKANVGFENAIAKGDLDSAQATATVALVNGTWTQKEYTARTEPMRDRVASNKYMQYLNVTDTTAGLKELSDNAIVDPDLKFNSRKTVYNSIQSKLKAVNTVIEKQVKAQKTEQSSLSLTKLSAGIIGNNAPLEWSTINQHTDNMTPPDRKALTALNRSIENGASSISDDTTLRMLTSDVKTLSFPAEGTTVAQRRGATVNKLVQALDDKLITPTDFSTLIDGVNKAQNFAYANPDHKFTEEEIWLTLTGGSKDIISQLFGGGEAKLNVVDATHELHQAAMDKGPSFDAGQWWEANQKRYIVKAIKSNRVNLQKDRDSGLIIMGNDGYVDMNKTTDVLNSMLKNGNITEDRMNQILTDTEKRDRMDRDWDRRLNSREMER